MCVFWLLLLSTYKFFFLLDCIIYACWEKSWKKFLEPPLLPTKDMLYIHKKIIIINENLCWLSSRAESRNYCMQLTIKLSLLTPSLGSVPKCHDLSHLTHVKYHRKLCKNSTTKLYWSTCIRSIMSTCITLLVNNFQSPIWKIVHILWTLEFIDSAYFITSSQISILITGWSHKCRTYGGVE